METINYSANNLQIAPNSQFNYFIPVKKLGSGTYKAHITLKNDSGFSTSFDKSITIQQKEVDSIKDSASPKQESNNKQWIAIIIGIIVLIAIAVWMYLYYSNRNGKKSRGRSFFKNKDSNKTTRSGNTRSSRHKK
ncbi:hypothetical protein LAL01_21730 [Companilactobacillus alimentarius]|uniref:WxL Interacting Protein host binding domain-containing protein n=1 Tax=Companilactobacillus alimentarius DSM 20249 TaxID=1423720 RepID=A0A2K9HGV6_9LACO|nr:DUF3324 domain-containing protein [Companilactobacillus alimentarius]AUI71774.1 hypothetical protein LA20249_06115 [Companilactobacillus alimentarius DSM 20249]KRK75835.1 cell surface protein [Companilactobacillus alimentarius DSM 20249]GEO45941.1 hypothetical protein LAL01_21730 [Companilactobacillus alimentarius]